jgi:hypothetical protein
MQIRSEVKGRRFDNGRIVYSFLAAPGAGKLRSDSDVLGLVRIEWTREGDAIWILCKIRKRRGVTRGGRWRAQRGARQTVSRRARGEMRTWDEVSDI